MNLKTVFKTAFVQQCAGMYTVKSLSASFESVGASLKEATLNFYLKARYAQEKSTTTPKSVGRPKKSPNRPHNLHAQILPESNEELTRLAQYYSCSKGEVIDILLSYHKHFSPQMLDDANFQEIENNLQQELFDTAKP